MENANKQITQIHKMVDKLIDDAGKIRDNEKLFSIYKNAINKLLDISEYLLIHEYGK